MVWNTGCNQVGNALGVGINIQDGENKGYATTATAKGSTNFNSVIFPWCDNEDEVSGKNGKAFQVSNIDTGKVFLYLFQEYKTNKICWSPINTPNLWVARRVIKNGRISNDEQVPQSALDIFIMPDGVWGLPATPPNQFDKIFQDVTAGLTTAATIAGVIATAAAAAP